jgi:hypothetical protein
MKSEQKVRLMNKIGETGRALPVIIYFDTSKKALSSSHLSPSAAVYMPAGHTSIS